MDDGSIAAEYYRLGVLEEGAEAATGGFFRLDTSTNADYGLSSTYPATLAVPSDATPAMISAVAAFRSRGRIPALTWRDPSGAAGHLVRCAQPTRGLLGRTADIDEAYVEMIRRGGSGSDRRLAVYDCRSFVAAHANEFRGGGVESARRYGVRSVEFAGLRNVHYVRRVLLKIRHTPSHLALSVGQAGRWLILQSQLLRAATRVGRLLEQGITVLLHCSDGWDRTPQVS